LQASSATTAPIAADVVQPAVTENHSSAPVETNAARTDESAQSSSVVNVAPETTATAATSTVSTSDTSNTQTAALEQKQTSLNKLQGDLAVLKAVPRELLSTEQYRRMMGMCAVTDH
jgi:hypothetical protein